MVPPDLSVCIVNWNGAEYLRGCLESLILAGRHVRLETLVVDNASTDGSAELVEKLFPDVLLVRNRRNLGFARANNQAAELAGGRHLLFLNNDTVVGEYSLRDLVRFLDTHPEVGLVGPRLIGRDGLPQRSYRYRPTPAALMHRITLLRWTGLFRRSYEAYRRREFDPSQTRQVEVLLGAAVAMPREVFHQHGGWDEGFPFGLEDFDLSTRVAATHQVVYLAGADILHFGKMSSRKNSGFAYTGVEAGYARFLRKHYWSAEAVVAYKLLVLVDLPFAILSESLKGLWRRLRHGAADPGRPHSEVWPMLWFATVGQPIFWRT
ncbi:MAG: glycosyltransferase family 2 protein [Gemmatales bacterium]|nr:glycosyltransferase family 2 protein [Gemmatales bacterium]MDW8388186.1 glycosyltransferase family 2 protein [Gemmatales bacterium]